MDHEVFEEEYSRLTNYLDQCKTSMINGVRESHPEVIDANKACSKRITELDRNWAMVPRYDPEMHERQRNTLLESRDQVENDAIRENFMAVKEESLDNWFAGSPDLREEASARIEKDPRYEWLKEQDLQLGMEQNQDHSGISNDFTQEAGSNIPPSKQEFEEQLNKQAEAILDTDKFPGFAHPDPPEAEPDVTETKMTPDSFTGYDTPFTVDHDAQPEAGIHYTPPTPPPKDGPDME